MNYSTAVMIHKLDNNDKRTTKFLTYTSSWRWWWIQFFRNYGRYHCVSQTWKKCILLEIFHRSCGQKFCFTPVFSSCWFQHISQQIDYSLETTLPRIQEQKRWKTFYWRDVWLKLIIKLIQIELFIFVFALLCSLIFITSYISTAWKV